MTKTILVTGGAGYIGSIAVKKLCDIGYSVVVVDNLAKGLKELVDEKAKFYEVDVCDEQKLEEVFEENKIDSVIHFAALKDVGESEKHPEYYLKNVSGTANLLKVMLKHEVKEIIFSSTAAVYKETEHGFVDESVELGPSSIYGESKLICERLIKDFAQSNGMRYIIFRYFNVAGDGGLNYMDPKAQNIFPIIAEAVFGKRKKVYVFGDDYETNDGTGVRDYIHVEDVVNAHIRALDYEGSGIFNLGTNKGTSVLELIKMFGEVSGKKIDYEVIERREGDLGKVIALRGKVCELLEWEITKDVRDMVSDTVRIYQKKLS